MRAIVLLYINHVLWNWVFICSGSPRLSFRFWVHTETFNTRHLLLQWFGKYHSFMNTKVLGKTKKPATIWSFPGLHLKYVTCTNNENERYYLVFIHALAALERFLVSTHRCQPLQWWLFLFEHCKYVDKVLLSGKRQTGCRSRLFIAHIYDSQEGK